MSKPAVLESKCPQQMLEEGGWRPYFVKFSFEGKAYVLLIYLGVFDLRRRYQEFGQTYVSHW